MMKKPFAVTTATAVLGVLTVLGCSAATASAKRPRLAP